MPRASTLAALLVAWALLPARAHAQPGDTVERKRREIEKQLGLPQTRPPATPTAAPDAGRAPEPPPAATPGPAAAPAPAAPAPPTFSGEIHGLLLAACRSCHSPTGSAAATRLVLGGAPRADFEAARSFVDMARPRAGLLVTKAAGTAHGGGAIFAEGSRSQRRLQTWIAAGAPFASAAAPTADAAASGAPASPPQPRKRPPAAPPGPPPVAALPPPPSVELPADRPAEPPGAAEAEAAAAGPDFATVVYPLLDGACRNCHGPAGPAGATRLRLTGDREADFAGIRALVAPVPAESLLLTKAAGTAHAGGALFAPGTPAHSTLLRWIEAGALERARVAVSAPNAAAPASPPAPLPAPAPAAPPPPAPPVAVRPHPHGGGVALPLGLHLGGRFDLNYERRRLGRDTGFGGGESVLRSYHQFLFLSRAAEDDPFNFTVELIALQFWEATARHRFAHLPLALLVRGGKVLVPFGVEPVFHQLYGGLIGFDQRMLPPVWAAEGVAATLVFRHRELSLTSDLYAIRGYRLRQPDAVLNLQGDLSPAEDIEPGVGQRLSLGFRAFSAYYSLYFNPLGFDRRLLMQALDLGMWRPRSVPVLGRFALALGALRADVSGGGAGQDYYNFGSYFQVRFYATDGLYLQYRQGLRTFNNRRGVTVDETRLDGSDGSTHTIGAVARWHGLTAGAYYFWNLEKANEVDDDFLRIAVTYEF